MRSDKFLFSILIFILLINLISSYDFNGENFGFYEDEISTTTTIINGSGGSSSNMSYDNLALTNQSNSFTGNQTTDSWFNGLFNWVLSLSSNWFEGSFNGSTLTLDFNESRLNETIDARASEKYVQKTGDNMSGDLYAHNIYPNETLTYDLGSGAKRWNVIYAANISAEQISTYGIAATENITAGDYLFGDGSFLSNVNVTDIWVNESGDAMTGNLNMTSHDIQNVNLLLMDEDSAIHFGSALSRIYSGATDNLFLDASDTIELWSNNEIYMRPDNDVNDFFILGTHDLADDLPYIRTYGSDLSLEPDNGIVYIKNNTNITNNLWVGGNITGNYFIGDGSLLTGITGGNNSWNESYANTLYISDGNLSIYDGLINNGSYLSTYNETYDTWSYNQTQNSDNDWILRNSSMDFNFNESRLNSSILTVGSVFNDTALIDGLNSTIISNLSNIYSTINSDNTSINTNLTNLYTTIGTVNTTSNIGILYNSTGEFIAGYYNSSAGSYADYLNTTAGSYTDAQIAGVAQSPWTTTADPYIYNTTANVGIGTDSPEAKLDIVGDELRVGDSKTDNTQKLFKITGEHYDSDDIPVGMMALNSYSTGNIIYIGGGLAGINSATNVRFYTSPTFSVATGTERMRIDGDGNVGIGTNSPSQPLEIDGSTLIGYSSQSNLYMEDRSGALNEKKFSLSNWDGNFFFRTYNDDDSTKATPFYIEAGAPSNAFRMDSDGKVGIGTNSPSANLEIEDSGNMGVTIDSTEGRAGLVIDSGATNKFSRVIYGQDSLTNRWETGLSEDADDKFYIAHGSDFADKYLTITNAGRVGIGVTSPDGLLELQNGDSRTMQNLIGASGSGALGLQVLYSNNVQIGFDNQFKEGGVEARSTSTARMIKLSDRLYFAGGTGQTIGSTPSETEYFTIMLDDGDVGIGTSSPLSDLHVIGNGTFSGNITAGSNITSNKDVVAKNQLFTDYIEDLGNADNAVMFRSNIHMDGGVSVGTSGFEVNVYANDITTEGTLTMNGDYCGWQFPAPLGTGTNADSGNEVATLLSGLGDYTYTCVDCVDYNGGAEDCSTGGNTDGLCVFEVSC